ncbi:hypothetical protein [Myroides sp.]|uniref:hypothetical protein n=1 Tax=Myroides sp. TaxID=1874736 RepID=UPI003F3C331C
MEILDLQHNTDSTKMTQPNAPDFIEQHFSIEFIEKARMQTLLILGSLYTDFSIDTELDNHYKPTDDFVLANLCNGTNNPQVSELISNFIRNKNWSENEVLYLTIAFISNPKFQAFIDNIRLYDEEEFGEEILRVLLSKHITKELPLYVFNYIHASILRFCSEFDLSDGLIDTDTFDNMKTHYSSLLI